MRITVEPLPESAPMKEKRISRCEFETMPRKRYEFISAAIAVGAWRMCGVPWKKWVRVYEDTSTCELVFEYE